MKQDMLPAQLRAARTLVGWSRESLAEACGVTVRTLARIEADITNPRPATPATIAAIGRALESAGVEFTNGDASGVRMKRKTE